MSLSRALILAAGATGVVAASSRPAGSQSVAPYGELMRQHNNDVARIREQEAIERKRLQAEIALARQQQRQEEAKGGRGPAYRAAEAREKDALSTLNGLSGVTERQIADRTRVNSSAIELLRDQKQQESQTAKAQERAPYLQAGAAMLVAGLGFVAGRGMGRTALRNAASTLKSVQALGLDAAKIAKTRTPILGTPKGDKMAAIVSDARRLGGQDLKFMGLGQPPKIADRLATTLKVSGAVEAGLGFGVDKAIGLDTGLSDKTRDTLRTVGSVSLMGGLGIKTGLTYARSAAPRPNSKSVAAIEAGALRLQREAKGVTGALTTTRADAAVKLAKAKSQRAVATARADAGVASVRGQARVARAKITTSTGTAVAQQQSKTAVAKATGQARRARAKAAMPATPSTPKPPVAQRTPKKAQRAAAPTKSRQRAPYKDSWTDSRGRVYTRQSTAMRKH